MPRASETNEIATGAAAWFAEQAAFATCGAEAPGKQVAMVERTARAGQMAPLHRRHEREAYRVLEGEVTFFVATEVIEASSGEVVVAPAGAARTFRVESEHARWLVLTTVSSLGRFNDFSRALACAGSWSPHEKQALAAIAKANGIELLASPGTLPA